MNLDPGDSQIHILHINIDFLFLFLSLSFFLSLSPSLSFLFSLANQQKKTRSLKSLIRLKVPWWPIDGQVSLILL